MTELTGISYTLVTSPRIAESPVGVNEVTVQDALDTLSAKQDDIDVIGATPGVDNTVLVSGSGKDDLGGGTTVGITSTFDNLQWSFASDYTATQSGTATAIGTQALEDLSASFVTNQVKRGAAIINYDDRSVSEVLSVIDENNLTHRALQNGIANDWTIGDNYTIHNIIQKNMSGGNQVAVDDLGATISPVYPTAFTQVVLTASSSATATSQEALEAGLFFKGVTIDNTTGIESSTGLAGTLATPCKNDTFAAGVIAIRKMRDVFLIGTNIIAADHSDGIKFTGADALKSITVLTTGAVLDNCTFTNQVVTGVMDGNILIVEAITSNLFDFTGIIKESGIQDTLGLGNSGNNGATSLTDVSSVKNILSGQDYAVIDAVATGSTVNGDRMAGNFNIINKAGAETFDLTFTSGTLLVDSSNTAGTIKVFGKCVVTDSSGVGCDVQDLTETKIIADLVAENTAMKLELDEMYALQGLDISNPVTVTTTNRTSGTISQTISGDGETTSTVTRDP